MKINVNDSKNLGLALGEAQSRCSVRCMLADRPLFLSKEIDERLLDAGVRKKNLPGATACIIEDHGKIANSYKGTPHATYVQMVRGSSDWFVTSIARVVYRSGRTKLVLTDEAKDDAARHLENY